MCLINDKKNKERTVSFYSHFIVQMNAEVDIQHRGVGGRVGKMNIVCRTDQEEDSRQNREHAFMYCFLISSCATLIQQLHCQETDSELEQVI